VRGLRTLCLTGLLALVSAPAALADTTQSTNWAGYADHGSGASFRVVRGSWIEPTATCTSRPTYSSYWVGIGGYSEASQDLEQIGTEVDCTASGRINSTAWYELVPSPSVPVHISVKPGDSMQASVSISGSAVTVTLYDATSKQRFRKTIRASSLDLSSAEWIVEAPSECVSASSCQTLPLANFGTAAFTGTSVTTSSGHTSPITSPAWQTTKINLRPDSRRFIVNTSSGPQLGVATPAALAPGSTGFKVSFSEMQIPGWGSFEARGATLRASHLVHPLR
jgi:hypothetical protein